MTDDLWTPAVKVAATIAGALWTGGLWVLRWILRWGRP